MVYTFGNHSPAQVRPLSGQLSTGETVIGNLELRNSQCQRESELSAACQQLYLK